MRMEREIKRWNACHEELIERIADFVPNDGVVQPLKGLHLDRQSTSMEKIHSALYPSFCVIAQGSRVISLGNECYEYDPAHYLLTTLNFPRVSQVLKASVECPYLSLRLDLDPQLVSSVMVETGYSITSRGSNNVRAIDVSPLDVNLLDAVLRLTRLLESPDEALILIPIITREIIYRLLKSNQGARLRHLTILGGYSSVIAQAVQHIHQYFDQPLRIEELAHQLGMSVSSFHYHFKAATAMSPLQFQKHLRLQEARRLMLSENLDAADAACHVGYNDPSHFSREYKSLFGAPPMRDIQHLRNSAVKLT